MLTLIFNYAFSSYLVVGDKNNLTTANDGEIILNAISIDFSNLEVGSNNSYIDIPIYVKSDSNEEIKMKLSNILTLKQGEESITLNLSYRESTIENNIPFILMNSGEGGRDGNTIVGSIRVTLPSLPSTQTYGNYESKIDMELSSSNQTDSATNQLSLFADVALVAVAGFDVVSSYTKGEKFLDTTIDYGTFNLNQKNSIEKNLFIKSNSNQSFKISFDTTELISQINSNYTIPLNYYFNAIPFTNNQYFTALNGKNEGETSIGVIKFETDLIDSSLLAGNYQGVIDVTVSLE
jgi:hypothetical protein